MKKSNGTIHWRSLSGEILAETDLSGTNLREYIYFAGRRVARRDANGTVYYFLQDHLGSTRVMANASGSVVKDSDYYPHGTEKLVSGTVDDPHKFAGMYLDSETGLYYTWFRMYSPSLGRWLTPDPIAGDVETPGSLNRYTYVQSNPVNFVDPLGLCTWAAGSSGGTLSCPPDPGPGLWSITNSWEIFMLWALGQNPAPYAEVESGTTFSQAEAAFDKAAEDIAKKREFKPDCIEDLKKLGITADQVRQGARQANFLNGVGSKVPLASLYEKSPVTSVRQAGRSATGTVGDFIANNPGTVAMAQLGGSDIFLNPAQIKPAKYWQNVGTVFHEVLHNVTGLTDPDIQRAFGLPHSGSYNVTDKLLRDCF